jgi:hypothetical protein
MDRRFGRGDARHRGLLRLRPVRLGPGWS